MKIYWFITDCWRAIKRRLWPDTRPVEVILADVRQKLSEMPAGKEVHEVMQILDEFEAEFNKKKAENLLLKTALKDDEKTVS